MARDYSDLLLSVGIYTNLTSADYRYGEGRTGTAYKVVVSGAKSQRRFFELVGREDPRAERIRSFVRRSERKPNDLDRLPNELVSRLKRLLGELDLDDGGFHYAMTRGGTMHRATVERYLRRAESRLASMPFEIPSVRSPRTLRKAYHVSLTSVAQRTGRSSAWVNLHDQGNESPQSQQVLRATADLAREKGTWASEEVRVLNEWVRSPLRFVPIRGAELVPNAGEKWVYERDH